MSTTDPSTPSTPLKALALNCTLKRSPASSSTDRMIGLLADALAEHDIETETIRIVDHKVLEGVSSDEGDGDEWPMIREKILDAQILLLAGPIWMGNPSSVTRKVIERLDAMISETDDDGRPIAYGKVAINAVVGNEDGAHNTGAQVYQGLIDIGFTVPAGGQAYWVGEAMGSIDFEDLAEVPDKVADTVKSAATNAAHLAKLLASENYPAG